MNELIHRLKTRAGPDGGIGRRAGLKHLWSQGRAGSTPALGTVENPGLLWQTGIFLLVLIELLNVLF